MNGVAVELANGTKVFGPMWAWRPLEGWFKLAGEYGLERIELLNVVSAQGPERTHRPSDNCPRCGGKCNGVEVVDYVARARADGWKPPRRL